MATQAQSVVHEQKRHDGIAVVDIGASARAGLEGCAARAPLRGAPVSKIPTSEALLEDSGDRGTMRRYPDVMPRGIAKFALLGTASDTASDGWQQKCLQRHPSICTRNLCNMAYENLERIEEALSRLVAERGNTRKRQDLLSSVIAGVLESNGYTAVNAVDPRFELEASHISKPTIGVVLRCPDSYLGISSVKEAVTLSKEGPYPQTLLVSAGELSGIAGALARQLEHGPPVNLVTPQDIRNWLEKERLKIPSPDPVIVALVRELSVKIIREIARNPSAIQDVEWRQMEQVVAETLKNIGFKVTLTPASKDGGRNIELQSVTGGVLHTYVIEIKHWTSGKRVGQGHVRKFVSVVLRERHECGLFLATSGFAGNAFQALCEVEMKCLRIGDSGKVVSLCKTYVKAESGLWLRTRPPEDVLFE